MTYSSTGPKPFEKASKSSHHYIVADEEVVRVLKELYVPPPAGEDEISKSLRTFAPRETSIQHVVAIDGGYTEVSIRESYPSAALHFFQFGALLFRREDLRALERSRHVAPEDIQKLKNIERLKFPLPTRGARDRQFSSLKESVRHSIWAFCSRERLGENSSLLDTLAWLVFHRYKGAARTASDREWFVSSHPYDVPGGLLLDETAMGSDYTFKCAVTGNTIYLTDAFRLHERIDEEFGAGGIAGYVAGAIEHLVLLHIIKNLLRKDADALQSVLFILDRPTGWFGVTAPFHKLMLDVANHLFANHNLYLAGLEKSGAFVDHAATLHERMPAGSFLILGDSYIYRHISPGEEDASRPYAATSYYGHKLIFKSRFGQMYVVSIPVKALKKAPQEDDLPNVHAILTLVEELHCDMYENALLPVALANKLVSLSAHPSTQILRNFAKATVPG